MDRKRIVDTEEASADTFVSALLIITGVIAAGVLINAVYPIIWNMAGTATSTAHESDVRMRTDIRIVTTYANNSGYVRILMKNVGSNPIGTGDIAKSTIVVGSRGDFGPAQTLLGSGTPSANGEWIYTLYKTDSDLNYWNTGETVMIQTYSSKIITGSGVYFQFILPNGVYRTAEFTKSA